MTIAGGPWPPRPRAPRRACRRKAFVLCNFNQSYKLTPDSFASWMRILKQAPGSVPWLLEAVAAPAENIARRGHRAWC